MTFSLNLIAMAVDFLCVFFSKENNMKFCNFPSLPFDLICLAHTSFISCFSNSVILFWNMSFWFNVTVQRREKVKLCCFYLLYLMFTHFLWQQTTHTYVKDQMANFIIALFLLLLFRIFLDILWLVYEVVGFKVLGSLIRFNDLGGMPSNWIRVGDRPTQRKKSIKGLTLFKVYFKALYYLQLPVALYSYKKIIKIIFAIANSIKGHFWWLLWLILHF